MMARTQKALEAGTIDSGCLTHVEVQHDDHCPMLISGRECRCDAFIGIKCADGKVMYITEEGLLTPEIPRREPREDAFK
jgi:hypothetical protein